MLGPQSRGPRFGPTCCCLEALTVLFIPHCFSSLSCVNGHLAIDSSLSCVNGHLAINSGGFMWMNSLCTVIIAWLNALQRI